MIITLQTIRCLRWVGWCHVVGEFLLFAVGSSAFPKKMPLHPWSAYIGSSLSPSILSLSLPLSLLCLQALALTHVSVKMATSNWAGSVWRGGEGGEGRGEKKGERGEGREGGNGTIATAVCCV